MQEPLKNSGEKESMKSSQILVIILALISLSLPACQTHEEQGDSEHHKIVATSPKVKEVVLTQQYVCQIHSQRHIKVCALANGYLEEIKVKEGQAVKKGDVLFKILPVLYKAKWDAELAEAKLAELELKNTQRLAKDGVVSPNEVALYEAKLAKALAKAKQSEAEWTFTVVKAPFDGIVDRQEQQLGSLIKEGEVLTTLSDNSLMWVYFNVPEARYLGYKHRQGLSVGNSQLLKLPDSQIELQLADGNKFEYGAGDTVTVEGKFNNETGNIPFRADFPNPKGLLRHGQTGNVLIHRTQKNALLIPQRATYEILDKQYVYVIGKDGVIHPREIAIQNELDDLYVLQPLATRVREGDKSEYKVGLAADERFVLEGVRQVHDGDKREYEVITPDEAVGHLKHHAE